MSSIPLICERCQHAWNYRGKALYDISKRVHCPKCNSTRIIDTLNNPVNKGFKRAKRSTSQVYSKNHIDQSLSSKVGVVQHQPLQPLQPLSPPLQPSPTLDLSEAKKMLGQPIPSVQHFKQQVQQQQPTPTPQIYSPYAVPQVQLYKPPEFTGQDFKILYALLDDFNEWMTRNKGVRHTAQRHREMGDLLARMFNKYGMSFALEVTFLVSHLAFMSPVVFHYYTRSRVRKQDRKKRDSKTPPTPEQEPPDKPEETIAEETTPKTVHPDKFKPFSSKAFQTGKPKTIKDFKT